MEIYPSDILPPTKELIMTPKFKIGNPVNMEDTNIEKNEEGILDGVGNDYARDGDANEYFIGDSELDPSHSRYRERNEPNFIYIKPRIINDRGCSALINMFLDMPFDEVTIENEHDITPSERVQKHNLSYKYEAGYNKDHMTLAHDSPEWNKALEVVGSQLIEHPDFDRITYMQIVHYKQDALFPFHRDMAKNDVGRDYGTCITQLNDDFHGGQLNVEGCLIPKRAGTMAFFNNSSEVWHGVEPIYDGERYVFLMWFGRDYESSEMQSMSEDTESGDGELSLEDNQ